MGKNSHFACQLSIATRPRRMVTISAAAKPDSRRLPPDQPPLKLRRSAEALAKAEGGSISGNRLFVKDVSTLTLWTIP
jgi:hypothetical protein